MQRCCYKDFKIWFINFKIYLKVSQSIFAIGLLSVLGYLLYFEKNSKTFFSFFIIKKANFKKTHFKFLVGAG